MAVGESASACSSGARAPRHRYRSITRVSATSAGNPRTPADIRRPPLASSNHRGRLRMADYVRRDSFSHARFIRRTREIDRSRSFFRATQTPAAWCPPESITSPREDKKSANHQRDNGSARAAPYCQARRGEPQDTRRKIPRRIVSESAAGPRGSSPCAVLTFSRRSGRSLEGGRGDLAEYAVPRETHPVLTAANIQPVPDGPRVNPYTYSLFVSEP